MTGLDIFALIVLGVLAATVLGVLVFLGRWPGKIADARGHHQADRLHLGAYQVAQGG